MNTSQIKNFAIASRNLLKAGVIQRFQVLGFDAEGNLTKGMPTRIQGGATLFAGQFLSEDFYDKWTSLYEHVQQVGVKEVYEEAAYTWFNRLVAIRIMQKNHFIDPVLAYTNEEARLPRIVAEARAGHIATEMLPADRARLQELLGDDSKLNEQFALLIENYCRFNPVIFNCFGGIEQYISLLLPDNILAPGGFIDLLNHTSYITDEDYRQSELIGWLYQYYIAEKKDEVFDGFKKGKKAEAEDIPAATQIFTPNWIVKYMVQNTLGRIYLDNNPYSEIKSEMKYLVEPAEPTPKDAILKIDNLEDYKMMDNACGSGHILVEGFDLFYKMYLEEAYSSRTAIENIFRKNLIGIDIDTRAKQLATFALLMKAAHIDPTFLDCKVMPRVLDMPGSSFSRPLTELLREFYMSDDRALIQETYDAFELLKQAHNLGSVMKFDISSRTRKEMMLRYSECIAASGPNNPVKEILSSCQLILALTDKYSSIVTNPPYMGAGNMNVELYNYISARYVSCRADLCTVFLKRNWELTQPRGNYAFIIPPSWMFLSTFENLRRELLQNQQILTLLHLSNGVFGGDFGTTSFVVKNHFSASASANYYRVLRKTFQLIDQEHLRQLFEAALSNEDFCYNFIGYSKDSFAPVHTDGSNRILYKDVRQSSFLNIPGSPIGYWVKNMSVFNNKTLSERPLYSGGRNKTHNNVKYVRCAWEVSSRSNRWKPYSNGGDYRKYYGDNVDVVDWGEAAKSFYASHGGLLSESLCEQEGITWNLISAKATGFRIKEKGFVFSSASPTILTNDHICDYYVLGFLNTSIARFFLNLFNPTVNTTVGDILNMPLIDSENQDHIARLTRDNVEISKNDWNAHETSWDFSENELVRIYRENHGDGLFFDANRLKDIVILYKEYWSNLFNTIHHNEEELNRLFIEIYGMHEELTPDAPMDEVTILQQGEISVEDGQIVWHDDVLVKQLISYAIGCMMGRYRLDRPGLHIAYPNPSPADVAAYEFQGEEFEIDDDGIIPLLGRDCAFEDNAYNRVVKFLSQVFGDSFLNENLNFIESALGKSVEDYLVKDFWKDHKKMYSNRPIYWLFSSKKGAFQCLAYMHRMNPYTAELVRSKYLLPYIDYLKGKIAEDTAKAASLSTVERRNLDKMQVALTECLEYEERLHNVADSQIGLDLDDGVVVNYAKYGDILAKIK